MQLYTSPYMIPGYVTCIFRLEISRIHLWRAYSRYRILLHNKEYS